MRHKLRLLSAFLVGLLPVAASATPAPPALDEPKLHALAALGTQYRFGGRSPEAGFDCSGLVIHVYERAWGISLPRTSKELSTVGTPVKRLQPGDLVFYNTRGRPFSHVGIYIGEGRFVHAPRPGQRVRAESVQKPYWKARFNGARRLAPPVG